MSHFAIEGARRRLGEAGIDLRWAREKNGAFPSVEAKSAVEKAVVEWQRARYVEKRRRHLRHARRQGDGGAREPAGVKVATDGGLQWL